MVPLIYNLLTLLQLGGGGPHHLHLYNMFEASLQMYEVCLVKFDLCEHNVNSF